MMMFICHVMPFDCTLEHLTTIYFNRLQSSLTINIRIYIITFSLFHVYRSLESFESNEMSRELVKKFSIKQDQSDIINQRDEIKAD